ncbi:hypothetical protein EON66_10500, partial [archaeon]
MPLVRGMRCALCAGGRAGGGGGHESQALRLLSRRELRELFILGNTSSSDTKVLFDSIVRARPEVNANITSHLRMLDECVAPVCVGISHHDLLFTLTSDEKAAAVDAWAALRRQRMEERAAAGHMRLPGHASQRVGGTARDDVGDIPEAAPRTPRARVDELAPRPRRRLVQATSTASPVIGDMDVCSTPPATDMLPVPARRTVLVLSPDGMQVDSPAVPTPARLPHPLGLSNSEHVLEPSVRYS